MCVCVCVCVSLSLSGSDSIMMPAGVFFVYVVLGNIIHAGIVSSDGTVAAAMYLVTSTLASSTLASSAMMV